MKNIKINKILYNKRQIDKVNAKSKENVNERKTMENTNKTMLLFHKKNS